MKIKMSFCGLVAVLFLYICVAAGLWQGQRASEGRLCPGIRARTPQGEYELFLDSLAFVESGGNPRAVGDGGKAIGLFQIWKIYVDDVNRILGKPVFDYVDRLDSDKSRAMVRIYLKHYASEKRLGRPVTFEDMARIHNGGPDGWRKESTKKYWRKVKRIMK